MTFSLPDLPYPYDALEPHMSADTLHYHHDKHHKKYLDTLNELIANGPHADKSLEEIILASAGDDEQKKVFNNAAQVWNHTFFWHCLSPQGGGEPKGELADRIKRDFGSLNDFKKKFTDIAVAQFGSGWAWLVDDSGTLRIVSTPNAVAPIVHGQTALMTCDVWEHAYYLDYQNDRGKFVDTFLGKLVNWDYAAEQMQGNNVESLVPRNAA